VFLKVPSQNTKPACAEKSPDSFHAEETHKTDTLYIKVLVLCMHLISTGYITERNFIGELQVTTMRNVGHQPRPVSYDTMT
jgi:hypothetical protein